MTFLKAATGLPTAYAIGKRLLKADDKLFERYERGNNSPTSSTIKLIEQGVPGSSFAFNMSPCLPGRKPTLSFWDSLSGDPIKLWEQLLSSSDELSDLDYEGGCIEDRLAEVLGAFLWQQTDSIPSLFDEAPKLSERLSTLLTLPRDCEFFRDVVLDDSEYRFLIRSSCAEGKARQFLNNVALIPSSQRQSLIQSVGELLVISDNERTQLSETMLKLDGETLASWLEELILSMAEPECFLSDYESRDNLFVKSLEKWRLSQLASIGFDIDKVSAMIILWRHCQATGYGAVECSSVCEIINKYATSRLLSIYGIANIFNEYLSEVESDRFLQGQNPF